MLTAVRSVTSCLLKASLQTAPRQHSLPLFSNALVCFFTTSRHKILEMIERQTNQQNLNKIYIQMASVSNQVRQDAIKMLLERIIEGEFPPETITNDKFNVHLKKHPELLFHAHFFRIGQGLNRLVEYMDSKQDNGKKQTVKDINDAFAVCFDALKKMQGDEAPIREIELYKSFAHYHCTFLKNIVDQSKVKLCLTKARDFYKGALTKIVMHAKVFLERRKKLEDEAQSSQIEIPKSQNEQSISSINKKLFELFQYFSEALTEMIDIESEIHAIQNPTPEETPAQKDPKNGDSLQEKGSQELVEENNEEWRYEYPKGVVAMESVIDKGINNYILIKDHIYKSQFYYRLKKILEEIRYEAKFRKIEQAKLSKEEHVLKRQEANKELVSKMNSIFDEGIEDFKKLCNNFEEDLQLQDQALILVEIRMHYFQLSEFSGEALQQEMGKEIQNIVNFIPEEKIRKKTLLEIIAYIKEVYDIDISRYVQKIPRALRVLRKSRRQGIL